MRPKESHDHVASLALQTDLPLNDADIAALREGYELLQLLRAQLERPAAIDTDLAPVFVPEFDL